MAGYRSESGNFPNKPNYKDLNLTLYPNQLDTRETNTNMKGFINVGEGQIPDFVMAEYVNTLADAVMSLQRSLGTTPMLYEGASNSTTVIEQETVSSRFKRIENGLFDERYGGKGWINNETRPTLRNHSHTGEDGQPPKINLTKEVSNLLSKVNLNLTQSASGLTAVDIFMSTTDNSKVSDSVNDKLSKKNGGTILGDVHFKKNVQTRFEKEYTSENLPVLSGVSLEAGTSLTGTVLSSPNQDACTLVSQKLDTLHLGKYVAIIRVKVVKGSGLNGNTNIARIRISDSQSINIKPSEFDNNTYRQYFFVFDHNSTSDQLIFEKNATTVDSKISLDYIHIQPMHPSVLDR